MPLLDEVYQYIEIRTRTLNRLPSIQGKLDLMLSQIKRKKDEETGIENDQNQALLVFEEGLFILLLETLKIGLNCYSLAYESLNCREVKCHQPMAIL